MRSGGSVIRLEGGASTFDLITRQLIENDKSWRFKAGARAGIFTDRLRVWRGRSEAGVWRRRRRLPKCWMLLKRWRSSASKKFCRGIGTYCCRSLRKLKPTGSGSFFVMALRLSSRTRFSTDRSWENTLCRNSKRSIGKMRKIFWLLPLLIVSGSITAQTKNTRAWNASRTVFEAQPAMLRLAPHMTITIRVPDPVNSVIVGDTNLFQAEYSPNEPLLVFARPVTSSVGQTNLVISTVGGRQFVLLLRSLGASADETEAGLDLLVTCRAAGAFFIEDTYSAALISETVHLDSAAPFPLRPEPKDLTAESGSELELDEIVRRQARQSIEKPHGDRIRVGIGQVTEHGSRLIVSFSVINSQSEPIE